MSQLELAYAPPFGEESLVAVEAIRPDVAILPVQRADRYGNSHSWGAHGVSIEAAHAARHVILLAEEIVTTFLATDFEGGRHARRVDQLTALEAEF